MVIILKICSVNVNYYPIFKPLQNWNVSNGNNFAGMFWGCSSLSDIKPLKYWDISNNDNFEDMFFGCSSSLDIKPLLNWNISKENIQILK